MALLHSSRRASRCGALAHLFLHLLLESTRLLRPLADIYWGSFRCRIGLSKAQSINHALVRLSVLSAVLLDCRCFPARPCARSPLARVSGWSCLLGPVSSRVHH